MPAEDKYRYHTQGLDSPSRDYYTTIKSDTVDFATFSRSVYVGTPGDVVAVREDGVAVPFKNWPGGILPIRCIRINATGTSANDFVVL